MPKFQRKIFQKVFSLLNTEKIGKCQFIMQIFKLLTKLPPLLYHIQWTYNDDTDELMNEESRLTLHFNFSAVMQEFLKKGFKSVS